MGGNREAAGDEAGMGPYAGAEEAGGGKEVDEIVRTGQHRCQDEADVRHPWCEPRHGQVLDAAAAWEDGQVGIQAQEPEGGTSASRWRTTASASPPDRPAVAWSTWVSVPTT